MGKYMNDNILNLNNPSMCRCVLNSYRRGHSKLVLNVNCGEGWRYFLFGSVKYYSGPMRWTGANLFVASKFECRQILSNIYPQRDISIDKLKSVDLFQVNLESITVQIVAHNIILERTKEEIQVLYRP